MMAVLALMGGRAQAADTWAGNTSANWNASNWTGSHNPPVSGDSLIFGAAGSSGTALNDDLTTSGFNIAGITYNSGAAAFTVTNNTFVLTGPVANNSSSLETINNAFSMTSPQTFTTTNGGGIALGGIISGAGGITAAGSGTLTLSGVNTYTGATTVSGGTLVLSKTNGYVYTGGTLSINGSSTLKLTGLTSGAQLHFSDKTFSFDSTGGGTLISDASGGGSPNFVASTCTYQTLGGAQDTIGSMGANGINLNGNYSTFNVASGTSGSSDLLITSAIENAGGITKTGAGTMALTGANTYTGTTTVSGGTLVFSETNGYVYTGGTLSINGSSTLKLTGTTSGAQLHFSDKTFSFDSTGGGTLTSDASGGGSPNFVASTCTYQTLGGAQDTIRNMGANGINLNGNYSTFNVASGTSGSSDLLGR